MRGNTKVPLQPDRQSVEFEHRYALHKGKATTVPCGQKPHDPF